MSYSSFLLFGRHICSITFRDIIIFEHTGLDIQLSVSWTISSYPVSGLLLYNLFICLPIAVT